VILWFGGFYFFPFLKKREEEMWLSNKSALGILGQIGTSTSVLSSGIGYKIFSFWRLQTDCPVFL